MPRELSKCKSWEKERRNRLNKGFEELAKVLPSYDPSINICKSDILKRAQETICELKEEINLLTSSKEENATFKDKQLKKLYERIKKLLIRNEQLTNLFKDAGIKPPKVVGTVKRFRKKGLWSNRSPQQSKDLQKKETEKENVLSTNPQTKPKRTKLVSTNEAKCSKTRKTPIKIKKLKKPNQKVSLTNNLLLLSQIPTVPAINQQLVFVPNAPVHNPSRGSTLLTVQNAKPAKSTKPKALNPINLNLGSSSLGPGTLILGNGNIISLLPQPQLMIPPLNLPSQTVVFSKVINNSKTNKHKTFIQSNSCITKTTQINKVPIPALTSKYANTSLLLNNSAKKINKKQVKIVKEDMVKSTKRKASDESKIEPKKSKTELEAKINKPHQITDTQTSEEVKNKENTAEKEKIFSKEKKPVVTDSTVITPCSNMSKDNTKSITDFKPIESSTRVEIADKNSEKVTESNQILEKSHSSSIAAPNTLLDNNELSEKSVESVSTVTTSCSLSKETEMSNKISITETPTSVSSTSSATTSTLSVSVHEDAMKNIDLNLVHSDLSNDIFASLQVPPGCQNAESTSPTAAFLLAFPLVSSIKVTEVIDEENSDSQRETPTLLQIGNMDNSKPSHADNLLNLDNFPFFNSKDMCSSYYNSKVNTNTNNMNIENKSSGTMSVQNSKLQNEGFNIYGENNTPTKDFKVSYEIFSKSESHILEPKTNTNKTQKLNETQNQTNHISRVLNNEQYVLFEDKSKENSSNVFQQNVADTKFKNFQQKSENEMVQIVQDKNVVNRKVSNSTSYTEAVTDKLQTACNVLSSNINTNFNMSQLPVSISNKYDLSDNIVYKNYSDKDVQVQMRKQLDNEENTANQMQFIFKSNGNNKDTINEYNKIITNTQKQFLNKEHNLTAPSHTFSLNPVKANQNIENCNSKSGDKTNDNTFHYNPFETVKTSKEISLNIVDNCSKPANIVNKDNQTIKVGDVPKKMNEVSPKSMDTMTPCYFSSNYSSTPNYKSDFSKPCPPCTYDNQRNYSNPFYTNCNYSYNYSDTNINQNYYKPDTKSCYSLNYENYQEYRKTDTTFNNGKNNASKEKPVIQNKTVNWMTEQKSQTSDCFLPAFTNQSYSFTSCISSDTTDVNLSDIKKTVDLADKRFSWSPTKLPNFLEPPHNFITPTLPTLVGDLALGNSLTVNDAVKNDYKYLKEPKRKTTYDNQANFLSVSQLVNQNKTDNSPARTTTRRLSGSKSKSMIPTKHKRFDKNIDKGTVKPINNFDVFYEQKNRSTNKNVLSSYSAEALIGNQNIQETKKCTDNTAKPICSSNFLTENIVPYFTTVDDGYMNQNQNFHNTYTHNSFQNNSYSGNSFIYTTPAISSSYLSSNFDSTHDYSTDNMMNYCGLKDKNCSNNKNYRVTNKEEKNISYPSNIKKTKKGNQTNNNALGNFEYPLLSSIQGTTNSPILPDDFQSHTTFLPPTAPYPCKNSLYQKQGNEFNTGPLLPLPGISRNNIQHPQVSPSLNNAGTSLTNFNLSTIFPEINKGQIPNALTTSTNKSKSNSTYLEGSFNADPKYNFSG